MKQKKVWDEQKQREMSARLFHTKLTTYWNQKYEKANFPYGNTQEGFDKWTEEEYLKVRAACNG